MSDSTNNAMKECLFLQTLLGTPEWLTAIGLGAVGNEPLSVCLRGKETADIRALVPQSVNGVRVELRFIGEVTPAERADHGSHLHTVRGCDDDALHLLGGQASHASSVQEEPTRSEERHRGNKGETDEAATNVVHFPNIKIDENGERYYIIKINARDIDLQRADELAKLLGDGATRTMALYQALHIIHWAFVVRKADHLLLMREGLFGPERLEGPNAVSWENNAHRKRRQG